MHNPDSDLQYLEDQIILIVDRLAAHKAIDENRVWKLQLHIQRLDRQLKELGDAYSDQYLDTYGDGYDIDPDDFEARPLPAEVEMNTVGVNKRKVEIELAELIAPRLSDRSVRVLQANLEHITKLANDLRIRATKRTRRPEPNDLRYNPFDGLKEVFKRN